MRCSIGLFLAASLACSAPAMSAEIAPPHLVYVAIVGPFRDHGDIEQSLGCDLSVTCEVRVEIGHADAKEVVLRLFADDLGGVSLIPVEEDGEGRFAIGRRMDIAWRMNRSLSFSYPVRPVRPSSEDGGIDSLAAVLREDLPAVATLFIAVKELRRMPGLAFN